MRRKFSRRHRPNDDSICYIPVVQFMDVINYAGLYVVLVDRDVALTDESQVPDAR
jgi:hypothetical protein